MALEATIVEKLYELRKWQMDQQEQLLKHQQEQRDILSQEQKQMFDVLSQSVQDDSLDESSLQELLECNSVRDSLPFSPSVNTPTSIPHLTQDDNLCLKVPELKLSKKYKENDLTENMYLKDNLHSNISIEGVFPFPSEKFRHRDIPIDDMPIPSPKKDFQTLLEETLQNSPIDTLQEVKSRKPAMKRPFLKKGEGLARFQPNSTPKRDSKSREKSVLSTNTVHFNNPKYSKTNLNNNQEKSKALSKISSKALKLNDNSKKLVNNIPSVPRKRLSLQNVAPPKRKTRSKSIDSMPSLPVPVVKKTDISHSDPNSSDLEGKTKREMEEVRIFEFLEEKAENSSFCSTSSTVVAFMQSTPLKTKLLMHKALQQKQQKHLKDLEDQDFEEIIRTTKSNMLPSNKQADPSASKEISTWDSMSQCQEEYEKLSKDVILPFGTDVDAEQEQDKKHDQNELKSHVNNHVRFAEFNEYKTISHNSSFLTDISNISMDSRNSINYTDDKEVWSDCSATTDSDAENHVVKLKITDIDDEEQIQDINEDTDDQHFKDDNIAEKTLMNESFDQVCDITKKALAPVDSKQATEVVANEDIFKTERLKNRLLELEHEIEIFRKETAALVLQRKKFEAAQVKLQNERLSLQRTFKEKYEAFTAEQQRAENNLIEERKRLAREKAALENRLKEAWDKAQRNKQERQDTQSLRDHIEHITEEFNQKENKWLAAQARQKSQIRVLQTENARLKEEIEKLKKKNTKIKKPFTNTKAIHQIGKILADQKKSPVINDGNASDEEFKRFVMNDMHLISNMQNPTFKQITNHNDKEKKKNDMEKMKNDTEKKKNDIEKPLKSIETITRNRNLYENLLKDATKSLDNVVIQGTEKNGINEEENSNTISTADHLYNEENDMSNVKFHNISNKISAKMKETQQTGEQMTKGALEDSINVNTNKKNIKEVRHEDGHIEYWLPNGNVKKVFPDTGLSKMIYYNGDVRQVDKEGKIKYYYAATNTWQTTMPDGLEIIEFPDGQVERRMKNGFIEVDFPDGSVKIVQSDGSEKWALPDGTTAETFADGEKVLTLPNGQREVHTKEHKRREYPDGTIKLLYPDGSQETRYANGRVRLRDKDGKLLLDRHH